MEGGSPAASHPVLWSDWKSLLNTVEVRVRKGKTVGGAEIKGESGISEHITSVRGCL